MNVKFKEEQKFTQWWLWLILIGICVLSVYELYEQLTVGKPSGDQPMSDTGLIFSSTLPLVVIALFAFMRLKTEIDENGIRMSFFPFVKKRVKWAEIKSAKIVNYGFVGGWGIRIWTLYGTVFNTKGNKGLAIELKNGKKFLIGTQKETELKQIVKKYL